MTAGVYTYTVAGTPPCPATSATVTVTENTAPNAGTNGTLTVCSTGGAVSLLAQLGGGPQGGGTWAGPSPVGGAGNYNPATMNPGVYTYTIVGVAPWTNATATVTVTENPAVSAGSNGSLSICATGAAVALSASLGGAPQTGGTWSGPSPVVGGIYDPATMTGGAISGGPPGGTPAFAHASAITPVSTAAPTSNSRRRRADIAGAVMRPTDRVWRAAARDAPAIRPLSPVRRPPPLVAPSP